MAAGVAWGVASAVFDGRPFFAPAAAIIVLAITGGAHGRRALEVGAGVTLGILVADVIVYFAGSGPVQLTLIVLLSMTAAVLLGGSALAVTQAGVSAAFVVVLEQPEGFAFDRTGHAAVGAASALLMSYVLLPRDPLRLVRTAGAPVLRETAGALDDIAAALDAGDLTAAHAALERARAADPLARDFAEALTAGRETAIAALPRRRALRAVEIYGVAGAHLDLALRNVRVLGRGALRALETGDHIPPGATAALRELAAATRALEPWLEDPDAVDEPRARAIAAARTASEVLEQTANLSVSVIVGGVRSAATDLLRATGLDREEAVGRVRSGSNYRLE